MSSLNIDTATIRRLRDNLLESKHRPAEEQVGRESNRALNSAIMRRIEPFAETMYLVMVADEQTDSTELAALTAALHILAGGQIDDTEFSTLLAQFSGTALRVGVEARIAQLGSLLSADREDRETAFTLAAVIALADGSVEREENNILELVREYLCYCTRSISHLHLPAPRKLQRHLNGSPPPGDAAAHHHLS